MTIDADVFDSDPVTALRAMFAAACPDHLPARLNAVGACAGFAAQAAVWRELVVKPGRNPGDVFVKLSPGGGELHYDSEAVSQFVFATGPDHLSFLSFPAAALANPAELPDVRHIARHVTATIGTAAFGRPRLPSFVGLAEGPRDALVRCWGPTAAILQGRRASEWPALLGAVAYMIIRMNRAEIAPRLAVTILLEAAVPMSTLDPATVPGSGIVIPPVAVWRGRAATAEAREAIADEAREVMPLLLPSLLRALHRVWRPGIAFVNLAGSSCDDLVAEDHAMFGRMFGADRRIATVPVSCDVLFLYCRFDTAGRIVGEHASLRRLIAETSARIAVVATVLPSRPAQLAAMMAEPGHAPVNLVLTVDRRGALFGRFFRTMFERMWKGVSMPVVWEQLVPRTLTPLHDVPATICVMEAGHVAFGGEEGKSAVRSTPPG